MPRSTRITRSSKDRWFALWCASAVPLLLSGCQRYERDEISIGGKLSPAKSRVEIAGQPHRSDQDHHLHAAGIMGGSIASFGDDTYHAEAVIDDQQRLSIYILGSDTTVLQPVARQRLTGYLRAPPGGPATAILLEADPLAEDPIDQTSRFTAQLPERLANSQLSIAVPGLRVAGQRYMVRWLVERDGQLPMPEGVTSDRAAELYLTSGGLYTDQDIESNGRVTAQQKYTGFRAAHDPNPVIGDLVCPITQTKANVNCTWIINGQRYAFCCPPCIDEFLQMAKSDPANIRDAATYQR